jgi:two-component system phosphate regulon response regulator PhoB/two-component system alkaline phosphatase synthesis response regulator PhoP
MRELIALVEDEADIREVVELHLAKNNFVVKGFGTIAAFRDFLEKKMLPDLIVLDLMLPDGDGLELCQELKRNDRFSAIPIIMLTARAEETDKVLGLELGADDYVTKPFSPKELMARVRALLRRRRSAQQPAKRIDLNGMLTIDSEKYEVLAEGRRVNLTNTEFRILQFLAGHPGWVYSRDQILEHLWGQDKVVIDRTVDVHIKHLREKLGRAAGQMVRNIRGVGYKIEAGP